jgi:hypothetical protein
MILDKDKYKTVKYAGVDYHVIFEGERILHLRSTANRDLVIHCPVDSAMLQEYKQKEIINESQSYE